MLHFSTYRSLNGCVVSKTSEDIVVLLGTRLIALPIARSVPTLHPSGFNWTGWPLVLHEETDNLVYSAGADLREVSCQDGTHDVLMLVIK